MRTVIQVLVGLALCAAIAYGILYSPYIPMFWEHEKLGDPIAPSITWRSYTMLAVLLAFTQVISFAVFVFS
jgi:hypothetical protein